MGGVDKGLQPLQGEPLVALTLKRLHAQSQPPKAILINANRHAERYAQWPYPVIADAVAEPHTHNKAALRLEPFAGPLAGFLAALKALPASCDWLLTVPCDTPFFPLDLLERLCAAARGNASRMAMAWTRDAKRGLQAQPVFCLLHRSHQASLEQYLATGGRKIDTWTQSQVCASVVFDGPGQEALFFNANTLEDLHRLAAQQPQSPS